MQLISLVGSAGSGKNAVADVLIQHYDFQSLSFAGALKDGVAVVFGWDRRLLEGDTAESRKWRESVDPWWAHELSMPDLTPRFVLQHVGTELFRQHFHPDMWLLTVKRRITNLGPDARIVITDARFPNELGMTEELGGKVVRVKRGENPNWWEHQLKVVANPDNWQAAVGYYETANMLRTVHESERAWARETYDAVIENDGTLADLDLNVFSMMDRFGVVTPDPYLVYNETGSIIGFRG